MKFVTVFLLILSLISIVYTRRYIANVRLGSQVFKSVHGSIKLKVNTVHSVDTFRLVKDKLKSNSYYTNYIDMNYDLNEIDSVSTYFTLTSPWKNPGSVVKKPVIYLRGISLIDSENKTIRIDLSPPNPNSPIKLKEERSLVRV